MFLSLPALLNLRVLRHGFLALAFLCLASCASYSSKTKQGLEAFERRDYPAAEAIYKEGAEKEGINQLIYLFDRGTILHTAGKYEESNKDFIEADKLAEIKDYKAIATEIATIVTNDNITHYKGEEFENVLISAYLAVNFAMVGKDDEALISCKRVNRKLELLRTEGKRDYALNGFAQYLSAVLLERDHNWNNAYVAYKKAYEISPGFSMLPRDLVKGALSLDWSSDLHKWKKTIPSVNDDFVKASSKELKEMGGVVFIFQNGLAPEKVVSPVWAELPDYRVRYNKHNAANLLINGEVKAKTEMLFDVEKAAQENLKQKYATYIAKRVAGVVAREVIGNEINRRTNNSGLGTVVKLAMMVASQPDLRSWLTLPANFQVARVPLRPGKYKVGTKLEASGGMEDTIHDLGEIEIKKPGDIVLLNYRSLND